MSTALHMPGGEYQNNVRRLRMRRGLSQAAVAKYLAVSQSKLSRLERAKQPLKADIISKLLVLFQCPYDELVNM